MTGHGSGGLESRVHIRAASPRSAWNPKLKSFNVVGIGFKPQSHLEVCDCCFLFATAWSQPSSTAQTVCHNTESFLPGAQLGCCYIGFQDGSEVTGFLCRVLSSAHPHLSCTLGPWVGAVLVLGHPGRVGHCLGSTDPRGLLLQPLPNPSQASLPSLSPPPLQTDTSCLLSQRPSRLT